MSKFMFLFGEDSNPILQSTGPTLHVASQNTKPTSPQWLVSWGTRTQWKSVSYPLNIHPIWTVHFGSANVLSSVPSSLPTS